MQINICSDQPQRLRLRCDMGYISLAEARGISSELLAIDGVTSAHAHIQNCAFVIQYTSKQARLDVLAYFEQLDVLNIPTKEEAALDARSVEFEAAVENNRFYVELAFLFARRYVIKLLPLPPAALCAYVVTRAYGFIKKALQTLRTKKLQVEVLDATVIGISIFRKEYISVATIMFLLDLSDAVQRHVSYRSRLALKSGIITRAQKVWKVIDNEDRCVNLNEVVKGDVIHVLSGSVLPIDGEIIKGFADLNESSLTGESRLSHKETGASVYAGTAVEDGDIYVRVNAAAGSARIDAIVDMVEESTALKAHLQSRAEHLSDALVPYSFAAFFVVLLLTRRISQALSVLMVDYSCAIKLSTPIAIASAMEEASSYGITVKGGKFFEALSDIDTVVFDKTGTLTKALPQLSRTLSFTELSEDETLRIAACIEEHFPHSIAKSITRAAEELNLDHTKELHTKVEYVVAHGIKTHVGDEEVCIGSERFIFDDLGVRRPQNLTLRLAELEREQGSLGTLIYMSRASELAAVFSIKDPIREDAPAMIAALKSAGIKRLVMLTGDSEKTAREVAQTLGIDEYHAEILPEDKSEFIKQCQREGHRVAMVGDGINDSPALACADVSIAMSDASDIARAVADVSIHNTSLNSPVIAHRISTLLMRRIHEDFYGIVAVNTSLIVLGLLGLIPAIHAAYVHNGFTFAVTLRNTLPLLRDTQAREVQDDRRSVIV